MEEKPKTTKSNIISTHGRRKEAVAKIRLFKGKGQMSVGDKPIESYFPEEVAKAKYLSPFALTDTVGQFDVTIRVSGSGKNSQLEAVIHGISKALIQHEPSFRPALKKAGLLKRDPRVKERRKYGRAQKARKGKQSPKR